MAVDNQALFERIRELPGLDADEKSALLGLLNTRKKYGLVWEDKPENVEEHLREKLPVLKEAAERRILSRESGAPDHILIEGDNLHALTALQYTHAGKIDVIYIDPPYNTGNKDFIYNDSFVDKEDSWRHSKWLSFMSKRLKLAKHLLKETGVIFISIDDNEQAQLKLLCDEIFGENNFIASFVWKRRASSGMADHRASTDHEFIFCVTKNNFDCLKGLQKDNCRYKNPDNDCRGLWISDNLTVGMGKDLRPNQFYDLIDPETGKIYPANPNRVWAYIPESMDKLIREGRVIFPKSGKGKPMLKRFLNELKTDVNPISTLISNIDTEKVGLNSEGTKQIQDILGATSFVYPKPISLIRFFINQFPGNNSIVLDFFAGSGTTLHATMALNADDGGSRQCILVTNNENNICEQVTYERNKRVIQGYTKPDGGTVAGLKKNSLRYYKTEFVERSPSQKNRKELTLCAVDLLCIRESCYEPLKGFAGRDKDIRVFNGAESAMVIIFDSRKIEAAVEMIKQLPGCCKVYVFSPGHYAYDDEFEEVADKVELCALPEAILQAYNKVLPVRKKRLIAGTADEVSNEA
ncbi:MAG: site-specific DNA-methyltransferase [Lentisphaerota bacterium]